MTPGTDLRQCFGIGFRSTISEPCFGIGWLIGLAGWLACWLGCAGYMDWLAGLEQKVCFDNKR